MLVPQCGPPLQTSVVLVKAFIVIALVLIVLSLGSALYHLLMDKEKTHKTARALTLRIALSIGLFFALLAAFGSGLIKPHSFREILQEKSQVPTNQKP